MDRSPLGVVVQDCKLLFVKKSANITAHMIARVASSMSDGEWTGYVPHIISDLIASDLL